MAITPPSQFRYDQTGRHVCHLLTVSPNVLAAESVNGYASLNLCCDTNSQTVIPTTTINSHSITHRIRGNDQSCSVVHWLNGFMIRLLGLVPQDCGVVVIQCVIQTREQRQTFDTTQHAPHLKRMIESDHQHDSFPWA